MGDESGDKRSRGRPKKSENAVEIVPEVEDRKSGRGRPRKAAELASQAVKDQSNRADDDGDSKGKRGRGRPKGSTGKRKKKARVTAAKKRGKSAKASSGGDSGAGDIETD